MTEKKIEELTELEKNILRYHILSYDSPTTTLSPHLVSPEIHASDKRNAFSNLVQYGFYTEVRTDHFLFTDDGFYISHNYFKYQRRCKLILDTIKALFKDWYKELFIGVGIGLIVAYAVYRFGWNGLIEPAQQTPSQPQIQSQANPLVLNIPKKTPSNIPPSKKTDIAISQPTISASNSNILIGPNTGIVNQTINNYSETKSVPLRGRLISCLDEIDKKIMVAFRAGQGNKFQGKLLPYQLADLQRLSAEDKTRNYIVLITKKATVYGSYGTSTPVEFELKPALLQ